MQILAAGSKKVINQEEKMKAEKVAKRKVRKEERGEPSTKSCRRKEKGDKETKKKRKRREVTSGTSSGIVDMSINRKT